LQSNGANTLFIQIRIEESTQRLNVIIRNNRFTRLRELFFINCLPPLKRRAHRGIIIFHDGQFNRRTVQNAERFRQLLLRARRIQVTLARTQMQADAIALLLFPGVQGHLLHQFRYRKPADFRRPAIALDRFDCQLCRQFRRFFMLQRFFSAFGVATSSFTASTTVVDFQR
jgi:hypothetical protein